MSRHDTPPARSPGAKAPGIALPRACGITDLAELGHGGFATVYRAWQAAIGREVAVKVDRRVLESERDRRRFLREAAAAGSVSGHPHVVDLYDAGVTDGLHPFLVMELCRDSYADILRKDGPISVPEVCAVGSAIADALHAAHQVGVLHRDVKPANILVNQHGIVCLTDFGLAATIGPSWEISVTIDSLTPAYAAPEALRQEPPTVLGDVYSLAATLYALLTGRAPWSGRGSSHLIAAIEGHRGPLPRRASIPPDLFAVLERAMSAEAADRHQSAAQLRDDLASVSNSAANIGSVRSASWSPQSISGPILPARAANTGKHPRAAEVGQNSRAASFGQVPRAANAGQHPRAANAGQHPRAAVASPILPARPINDAPLSRRYRLTNWQVLVAALTVALIAVGLLVGNQLRVPSTVAGKPAAAGWAPGWSPSAGSTATGLDAKGLDAKDIPGA